MENTKNNIVKSNKPNKCNKTSRMERYNNLDKEIKDTITLRDAYSWDEEKGLQNKKDIVVVEQICEFYKNDEFKGKVLASPHGLKELLVGHIISEGNFKKDESITEIKIIEENEKIIKLKLYMENKQFTNENNKIIEENEDNDLNLKLSTVKKIMVQMPTMSNIWELTGGVHWAGLFDMEGNKLIYYEDIGRHNAIDKVIGYAKLNNLDISKCIIVSSGRQPTAMVKKVINAGCRVIITKSPSTNHGIDLANKEKIVLLCFARINRFMVYSGLEYINFEE
ncbi:formate dehydrogenase accessory sulfurtransferase FdhD [Methanococcus voltae]|uniref:Formate dehydrogenase family accessory protein FdhD n=1 Tax=Methanococcus voltae (strain ATCC BAA-1334 / A3) TaxID=456320 RepID=D7DTQ4_METV3|nr:formate dehydrogenase accessory sulfurtransferase FdhD [Methanococcus voltae]MCS3901368.1 FdhD protein [Methanococcus voltae]